MSIAIVAVTGSAIAAIFAIASISVIIAILASGHVDTIDDHTGIGQLAFAFEATEEVEGGLGCIVGSANIDIDIGMGGDEEGVGDKADGGGVKDDIVVVLLQELDDVLE